MENHSYFERGCFTVQTMGIIGCILGFIVVVALCYKDWSVYTATFVGACVVALFTWSNLITTLIDQYIPGVYISVRSFFFLLMFGCILSCIYRESGAANAIANTIMKRMIRANTSDTKKNIIGMSILLAIGTILSLGGIIAGVVIVLMYPIALSVFEYCDIPKKYILGVLGAASYTFTLKIPGSPQVTNVAAMNVLGTSASVAMVSGLVGCIVEVAAILIMMNIMINGARKKGEHFERHPLDPKNDPDAEQPPFLLAVIPMAFLFIVFNAFNIHIVLCLIFSCMLSVALFWKYLKKTSLVKIFNEGAVDSIPMTMAVGAICGFAEVVTKSDSFQVILDAVIGINLSPIVICAVVVAVMCMLTGGSSTGQIIALPLIAPNLIAMGLSVENIHRISVFASTALDSLPYSGSILMLLPMCHMKLKEIYPSMFVTTTIASIISTLAVMAMAALFPTLI